MPSITVRPRTSLAAWSDVIPYAPSKAALCTNGLWDVATCEAKPCTTDPAPITNLDAAATKSFGFTPFYPGPGIGGHSIPVDPIYLTWKARQYDCPTRFIELAGEVNTGMPYYVVDRVSGALNDHGKAVRDAKVLILGVAYKRDVDDLRESPALRIIELLSERGAVVAYHDPYVPQLPRTRKYDLGLSSVPLTESTIDDHDVVVVVTDHGDVDYALVGRRAALVVDSRNVMTKIPEVAGQLVQA